MEKQNPNKDFNMDDEIKKVQEELIKDLNKEYDKFRELALEIANRPIRDGKRQFYT